MALSELPDDCGSKHVRVFVKFGWVVRRESPHYVLTHPNVKYVTLSIPNHRSVKLPLLHAQIKRANLTDKMYRDAYDEL